MNILIKTLLICGLISPFAAHAQQVKEGIIKVGKQKEHGFIATSDKYGKAEIKEILAAKLEEAGLKSNGKKKKFYNYTSVVWAVTGRDKVDLSYRVVSRKRKTIIYFIAARGFENYITSARELTTATDISNFLAQLDTTIAMNEAAANTAQTVKGTSSNAGKQTNPQKAASTISNTRAATPPARLQSSQASPTY